MKSLRNIFIIIAAIAVGFSTANAQRSKTTNTEIKTKLLQNIVNAKNGDVILNVKVNPPKEIIQKTKDIPASLLVMLLYVDSKMDFDKYNKIMAKTAGTNQVRSVDDILEATDKYLSSNNMQLKPIKFSANNARLKLDQGLPLFISLYSSGDYDKIANREKSRIAASDVATWKKSLGKLQLKSININKSRIIFALMQGYNKQTGEFLIVFNGKKHWFTESELKKAASNCHELRI